MALRKIRLHHEAEILLSSLHLQHWCIVIAEMIICPLPQIRMRRSHDDKCIAADLEALRFPRPLKQFYVNLALIGHSIRHSINELRFRGVCT